MINIENIYADFLDKENEKRKLITAKMEQESISMVRDDLDLDNKKSIVLYKEGWHPGIVGIVASRIKELFNRPTIIIAVEKGIGKGSCRSIPKFDIVEALKSCKNLLNGFGGHPMAAGLIITPDNLDKFIEQFELSCSSQLNKDHLIPFINIDAEINLSEINNLL